MNKSLRSKINVAVIGLGDTGIIHANAYMSNPNATLYAVCDKDENSLKRFVSGPWNWPDWLPKDDSSIRSNEPTYPVKKILTDYYEIAKDKQIDAVSICLPDPYHSSVAKVMLEGKKHVLVEKPMAGTIGDCEEMIKCALRAKVKLLVAHMWRFHPEVQFIKKIIEKGVIGQVVKTKGYAIYVRSAPNGWFLKKEFAIAGPLFNIGVHAIDTVRFFLGDPVASKVYAKVDTKYGKYDVDDLGVVFIEFLDGPISIIETGQNHPYSDGEEASTQLFGIEGYARVFPTEVQYRIGDQWGSFKPDINEFHISPKMFQEEINHFIDCILYDKKSIIDGEIAMENVKIIEAAYTSSRIGKVVKIL